ncbi:MAG: type 1 glutamine amidotransferase [Pseudomonadota bacterium]
MHIGILQCGYTPKAVAAQHGQYTDFFHRLFEGQGLRFTTWNVIDMTFPTAEEGGIDAAEGWLITGSRYGAYDDLPFIAPLEEFIRAVHAARRPMIGICFGHQIIAQALGGRVEKFAGGWSIGRQRYARDGGDIYLNAWHQDQVLEPPPGARTVAASDFCAHAALAYGDHIMTIQPHPEISNPILRSYLEARRGAPGYEDHDFTGAEAQLHLPGDEALIAAELASFLKEARP